MNGAVGPYASAAWLYRAADWVGVLPLPVARKAPVPLRYTGWAGVDPSGADVAEWIAGREGAGNIALRLPYGVYGLDVDAYGTKTGGRALEAATGRLGPLPATWVTTSREDGISGIRLFRAHLGPGLVWRDEPAGHGAGIEAIHFGHRYAVVAPSVHPDTARKYVWLRPDGGVAAPDELPHPDALPELPAAWIEALARPGEVRSADAASHAETVAAVGEFVLGGECPRTADARARALARLRDARNGAALHPAGRDATNELVHLGHEKHVGVRAALAEHYAAFVEVRVARGGAAGEAEAEWWRLVRGAVGKLPGAASVRETCECGLWSGEGLLFDPVAEGVWAAPAIPAHTFGGGTPFAGAVIVGSPSGAVDPVDAMASELLTWDQLADSDPPEPLIHGLLDRASVAYLIGKPGSLKTFVALSFAACVATGHPWLGHKVETGPVVYILAEGQRGGAMRAAAWRKRYGWQINDVHFLRRPVQANGPEWLTLIALCERIRPALIVIDTQAKVTIGMEENSNTEMSQFIARAEMLKIRTAACVLILHHIGRSGADARGASSVDGAQDTEIKVTRVGKKEDLRAQLNLDKQKDGPDTEVVELGADLISLGTHPQTGRELSSLVINLTAIFDPFPVKPWLEGLADNQAKILDVLHEHFRELGASKADARKQVAERFGAMANGSFNTAWDRLAEKGLMTRVRGTQRWVSTAALEISYIDERHDGVHDGDQL